MLVMYVDLVLPLVAEQRDSLQMGATLWDLGLGEGV